jgi:NAD(P)-dependent dehydrogenase (short-subunit alcohol dehydrogenase family)
MSAILITGVSSGLGKGLAQEFIRCGYQVLGSVRRETDAQRLQDEIGENFIPLIFDVNDPIALKNAADQVTTILNGEGLVGLINNAGIATTGPLLYQPIEEIQRQFEVNVFGPISVIQAFFPLLKRGHHGKPGKIINISSVGGRVASPFGGAYSGSKHALEGISHSLRRELLLHGIDVIIIGPGAIDTPIWDKDGVQSISQYDDTEYATALKRAQAFIFNGGVARCSTEKVCRFIRTVFERKYPKARYAIVADPFPHWILPRLIPHRWFDLLVAKTLGLRHRDT